MEKYGDIEVSKETLIKLEEIMIKNNLKDTDETIRFLIKEYGKTK